MIPLLDLTLQYRAIREEVNAAITRVLERGQFVLGEEVEAFEEEFAKACGAAYGVGVNSGTSALHLALRAAAVGPGDEVITVPFTFVATVAAIEYTGARPVFVDIEPRSLTMDVTKLAAAITPRTKAIVPVHLYGQPADMDPILDLARRHRLIVIEDAAQAHLAEYKGRRVGNLGDLACFSFYPSKNLGAYGEGGIVVTSNQEYARTVRMLRDWGQDRKYHHALKGYNYRLETLQAAILRVKLRHLEEWTERRYQRARLYTELLEGAGVRLPQEIPGVRHVYHVYAIRSSRRDALRTHLGERGVQTGIHYPIPLHLQEACRDFGHKEGDFPVSEACAGSVLSLPIYPELTEHQVREVATAVRSFDQVVSATTTGA
jgi:dTDP-4-amino-4,6-dideoxygalactose transaminase